MPFAPEYSKSQEVSSKFSGTCPFVCDSVLDWYMTQDMCDKIVSKESFQLKDCLDKFKTQEKCDKAIDSYLPPFKLISDFLLLIRWLKNLIMVYFLMMISFLVR